MNSFYQATPPPPNPPPMARPINFNNPPPPPPAVPLVSPQRTQQMRGEVPALKGQISMAFFTTEIPATATAFFSTNNGKNPKRHLTQPYPMPIARSQLHTDVALAAVDLRDRFPTIVRDIKALADWRDLYKFWDGYDLWVQGAAFCWWVMEQIVKKNVVLEPMIGKEIKKYAVEWTEFHKSEILACHPSTLITTLFTPDEADGLNIMTLRERGELKAALDEERRKLFDATRSLQQQPLHPIREREPLESFPPFINQTPVITQAPLFPRKFSISFEQYQKANVCSSTSFSCSSSTPSCSRSARSAHFNSIIQQFYAEPTSFEWQYHLCARFHAPR